MSFPEYMFVHCTDRWDYAVAYGWVYQSVNLFLDGRLDADKLRAITTDVEWHKKAYYVLRDQGVTATAALESLRDSAARALTGADSPVSRGATPQ